MLPWRMRIILAVETTQSIYEVTNKFVDMLGKKGLSSRTHQQDTICGWTAAKQESMVWKFSSVIDGLERCARDYELNKRIV